MKKLIFFLFLTSCITFNYTYECPCKDKLIELDPDPYWWYDPIPPSMLFRNDMIDTSYWYPLGDSLIIDTSLIYLKP